MAPKTLKEAREELRNGKKRPSSIEISIFSTSKAGTETDKLKTVSNVKFSYNECITKSVRCSVDYLKSLLKVAGEKTTISIRVNERLYHKGKIIKSIKAVIPEAYLGKLVKSPSKVSGSVIAAKPKKKSKKVVVEESESESESESEADSSDDDDVKATKRKAKKDAEATSGLEFDDGSDDPPAPHSELGSDSESDSDSPLIADDSDNSDSDEEEEISTDDIDELVSILEEENNTKAAQLDTIIEALKTLTEKVGELIGAVNA